MTDAPTIVLERWDGPWDDDDPDAAFKADVALYSRLDPLATMTVLAGSLGVPVGALARSVLARWAADGSAALLEIGPSAVARLVAAVDVAQSAASPEEELAAWRKLGGQVRWLAAGL